MKRQSGFTLIELIMVIVILGILAAVAIPKYIDFKGAAEQAAAAGVAGGIASSAVIQYASDQVNNTSIYTTANACSGVFLTGGIPSTCSTPSLSGKNCTVTCGSGSKTVTLP